MNAEIIKDHIGNISSYFIGKILTREFEVLAKDRFTIIIKIDDEFKLYIWIANGASMLHTTSWSDFVILFTEEEKTQIFDVFAPEIQEFIDKELIEYNRLKKKFENK